MGEEVIPENRLATYGLPPSSWRELVRGVNENLSDYEYAGSDIGDGSNGMWVRQWYGRARNSYDDSGEFLECFMEVMGNGGDWQVVLTTQHEALEFALAFDNNMNPAIAYEDSSGCYLYWYDPVTNQNETINIPNAKSPRLCIDEKRSALNSNTDIILSYCSNGNFCIRYHRERFTVENILSSGIGPDARVAISQINSQWRLQWLISGAEVVDDDRYFLAKYPMLADIVTDLLSRSGIQKSNIDVSGLYTEVLGYKVATQGGADSMIQPLRTAYFFDSSEYDKKLRFPKRGGDPVASIQVDDMLEEDGAPIELERVQEAELLRKVTVGYIDPEAGYSINTQAAERRSQTVMAKAESGVEVPITATADDAATIASRRLKVAWGELHKAGFRLGVPWSAITPADVVEVTDQRGNRYRMRVLSVSEDSGQLEFEMIEDADWAYRSSAKGVQAAPPTSTTPGLVGNTTSIPMNLPSLRSSDNVPGIYIASYGSGTGWVGAEYWISADNGVSYFPVGGIDIPSSVGKLVSAIGTADDPIYVEMSSGELFSVTPEQLSARQNAFALVDGNKDEIGNFLDADKDSSGNYELSTITRGLLETTAQTWSAGDSFVLLDEAVVFCPIDHSFSNRTLLLKAVSYGQTLDDASPVSFLYEPPIFIIDGGGA